MQISLVFWQMVTFFLLILVGVVCARKDWVELHGAKTISGLIVNIFNPAMLLSSVAANQADHGEKPIGTMFLIAAGSYLALVLIAEISTRFFARTGDEQKMFRLMTVFANVGFVGLPLVNALYGAEYLIYVALYVMLFQIFIYTYGVLVLTHGQGSANGKLDLHKVLNPGTISCVIALVLFYFDIPLPSVLADTVNFLGGAATPLALMSIGFSLGHANFSDVFFEKRLYAFSLFRLLLVPLAGIFILRQFRLPTEIAAIAILMLGMPIGNLPVNLAYQYDVENEICSEGIIITTLLSILTIPLIAGLM